MASKPTPKKKAIIDSLKAQLDTIDGTGDYHHSLKVLEIEQDYDSLGHSNFPVAYVKDSNEAFYSLLGDGSLTTGKRREDIDRDGWFIVVSAGLKRDSEGQDLNDELLELEWDIIYSIAQNNNLDGNCDYIFPTYRDKNERYSETYGWINIVFAVNYDFRPESAII